MRPVPHKSLEEVNAALDEFAAHLGIGRRPAIKRGTEQLWDGKTFPMFSNPEDTAHEIAHWMLVSKRQRKMTNFGWYSDYQYNHPTKWDTKRKSAPPTSDEYRACILGFSFMVRLGHPDVFTIWDDYGFYSMSGDLNIQAIEWRADVQPHINTFKTWMEQR